MVEDIPTAAVTELSFNTQLSNSSDLRHNKPTSERKPDVKNESPLYPQRTTGDLQYEEASRTTPTAAAYESSHSTSFAARRKQQEAGEAAVLLRPQKRTYAAVTAGQGSATTASDKAQGRQEPRPLDNNYSTLRTHQAYASKERTPANMESRSH
ncbi:hypothetical protein GE061_001949 [Apolygus lucorum]|uniref:Uncharacterized protein n=1 Tax=Apolygus lucorum TaxID=248454 RepID=A0A8S9X3S3_APOLU|nr:hypothetical protein GE061_001949 [Apolygus lucorum]